VDINSIAPRLKRIGIIRNFEFSNISLSLGLTPKYENQNTIVIKAKLPNSQIKNEG
jgi:hypothetical protein